MNSTAEHGLVNSKAVKTFGWITPIFPMTSPRRMISAHLPGKYAGSEITLFYFRKSIIIKKLTSCRKARLLPCVQHSAQPTMPCSNQAMLLILILGKLVLEERFFTKQEHDDIY